ncbi:MAG: DNRLRE domain-containing protein [Candidatus Zixiibacteriota bacterium]
MSRLVSSLVAIAAASLLVAGCSIDQSPRPTADNDQFARLLASNVGSIASANFFVYVDEHHGGTVDLHRITADWQEMTVTHEGFGSSWDPTVVTSFTPNAGGYYSLDVTALVQAWFDGTYPNYGLLLDQNSDPSLLRTKYISRENPADFPFLVVCFTGGGCDTLSCTADAWLWRMEPPGSNNGADLSLYTGYNDSLHQFDKQSLFRFDLQPPQNCNPCDGKVTELTLQYNGSIVDAQVVVTQKKGGEPFNGVVQPGEMFTFTGVDQNGTLGTEIQISVNGALNAILHTSCSQPIGPGVVRGDFTVIDGYSLNGGLICPPGTPGGGNDDEHDGEHDGDHDGDDDDHHGKKHKKHDHDDDRHDGKKHHDNDDDGDHDDDDDGHGGD